MHFPKADRYLFVSVETKTEAPGLRKAESKSLNHDDVVFGKKKNIVLHLQLADEKSGGGLCTKH
jgi:hypothetical protein